METSMARARYIYSSNHKPFFRTWILQPLLSGIVLWIIILLFVTLGKMFTSLVQNTGTAHLSNEELLASLHSIWIAAIIHVFYRVLQISKKY